MSNRGSSPISSSAAFREAARSSGVAQDHVAVVLERLLIGEESRSPHGPDDRETRLAGEDFPFIRAPSLQPLYIGQGGHLSVERQYS